MIVNKVLFCLYLVIFVVAGQAVAGESPRVSTSKLYLVGLADRLDVQVWHEDDLSRQGLIVRLDGYISLPLIGDIMAHGKSIPQITEIIQKKLGDYLDTPTVTVSLAESRSRSYYLIGSVATSAEFPIEHPISVVQAIARAGGFTEWAKKDKVKIIRPKDGKDIILHIDYEAIIDGEELAQNVLIEPGDTIVVP